MPESLLLLQRFFPEPFQPKIVEIYKVSLNGSWWFTHAANTHKKTCTDSCNHSGKPNSDRSIFYYKRCKLWNVISSSIIPKMLSIFDSEVPPTRWGFYCFNRLLKHTVEPLKFAHLFSIASLFFIHSVRCFCAIEKFLASSFIRSFLPNILVVCVYAPYRHGSVLFRALPYVSSFHDWKFKTRGNNSNTNQRADWHRKVMFGYCYIWPSHESRTWLLVTAVAITVD